MTNTDVNGWVLTDDDSSQYLKRVTESGFDCVEVRALPGGKFAVVRAVLDLDVLPREDLESIIESYYESVDEVYSTYGEMSAAQIMAECLFEQRQVGEMDESFIFFGELGALEMVQKLIRS